MTSFVTFTWCIAGTLRGIKICSPICTWYKFCISSIFTVIGCYFFECFQSFHLDWFHIEEKATILLNWEVERRHHMRSILHVDNRVLIVVGPKIAHWAMYSLHRRKGVVSVAKGEMASTCGYIDNLRNLYFLNRLSALVGIDWTYKLNDKLLTSYHLYYRKYDKINIRYYHTPGCLT